MSDRKCNFCHAPVRAMPPDGDVRYDPPPFLHAPTRIYRDEACPWCGNTPDFDNPATYKACPVQQYGAIVCDCKCAGPAVRTEWPGWQYAARKAWRERMRPNE